MGYKEGLVRNEDAEIFFFFSPSNFLQWITIGENCREPDAGSSRIWRISEGGQVPVVPSVVSGPSACFVSDS